MGSPRSRLIKNVNQKLITVSAFTAVVVLVLLHFIPLATKSNNVCGHGEVFKFSILLTERDGGLDDYRNFHDFVRSFGSGECGAPEKAKLYLW
jgi:hypothetical protein